MLQGVVDWGDDAVPCSPLLPVSTDLEGLPGQWECTNLGEWWRSRRALVVLQNEGDPHWWLWMQDVGTGYWWDLDAINPAPTAVYLDALCCRMRRGVDGGWKVFDASDVMLRLQMTSMSRHSAVLGNLGWFQEEPEGHRVLMEEEEEDEQGLGAVRQDESHHRKTLMCPLGCNRGRDFKSYWALYTHVVQLL